MVKLDWHLFMFSIMFKNQSNTKKAFNAKWNIPVLRHFTYWYSYGCKVGRSKKGMPSAKAWRRDAKASRGREWR